MQMVLKNTKTGNESIVKKMMLKGDEFIYFLLAIATVLATEGIYCLVFLPSWAYGNVEEKAINVLLVSGMLIITCSILYFSWNKSRGNERRMQEVSK